MPPSPEFRAKAQEHLDRINAEIANFPQHDALPGSQPYLYLERLRAQRDMWMAYLDQ
jgi:hypothetical protein